MKKVTFCPKYFIFNENEVLTVAQFLVDIFKPLSNYLDIIKKENMKILICKEYLDDFANRFPWNKVSDNEWKSLLIDWNTLVLSRITKYCYFEVLEQYSNSSVENCSINDGFMANLFNSLLLKIVISDLPDSRCSIGVIKYNQCESKPDYYGCTEISKTEDLIYVLFPWTQFYDAKLPTTGEYPFIPPENWNQTNFQKKGTRHGYLDQEGNEWIWDKFHNDHWDVQTTNSYIKVSSSGKILT